MLEISKFIIHQPMTFDKLYRANARISSNFTNPVE